MTAEYNRTEYVSLEYICDWMSYYTHHSDMDSLQCVRVDVTSDYFCHCMFYYRHHNGVDAHQYVHADVPSDYFWN